MASAMKVLINIWGILDEETRGKAANNPDALKALYDADKVWHDELIESVLREISALYAESVADSEAYIDDDSPFNGICFGFTNPKSVALTARGWNDNIRKTFADAVLALEKNHTPDGKLPLDNSLTYEVKKAAMALDNDFYAYAEYAVALKETNSYLACVIDDKSLADIIARPERYAVATVYVN